MFRSQFQRRILYKKRWRDTPVQSTYFATEPSCFRMLRDCRSMLAAESNQLYCPILSVLNLTAHPAPKMSTQRAPAALLHQVHHRVQTLCVLGCQFSFLFSVVRSEVTFNAYQWMRKLHTLSVSFEGEERFFFFTYSGSTVTLRFKRTSLHLVIWCLPWHDWSITL